MLYLSTCVFFAYIDFDSVAAVVQEAKTPTRSIPIVTISSLVISFLIYTGVCTVIIGLTPYKLLDSDSPISITLLVITDF